MDYSQITLKVPVQDISEITGTVTKIYQSYIHSYLSIPTDEAGGYITKSWALKIVLNVPEDCIFTSMRFPLQTYVTTPETDGASFAVAVDNTQYEVTPTGDITDNNFITHINNYKNTYGVFPELEFRVGAWGLKPQSDVLSYPVVAWQMSLPIITCNVNKGSTNIFRPNKDISVGHTLLSGFSHAYQLINEVTADDDVSYLGGRGSDDSANDIYTHDKTSVVSTNFSTPSMSQLVQLNIRTRALLTTGSYLGIEQGQCHITIGVEVEDVFKSCTIEAEAFTNDYDFLAGSEYFYMENIFNADSDLVIALNNYYKTHHQFPEIVLHLTTYCDTGTGTKDTHYNNVAKISQVYIEAVYAGTKGLNIYTKELNSWKRVLAAYKKQNGIWTEISEEDCKNTLSNKYCLRE